jgi:hypothetical protein
MNNFAEIEFIDGRMQKPTVRENTQEAGKCKCEIKRKRFTGSLFLRLLAALQCQIYNSVITLQPVTKALDKAFIIHGLLVS